MIFITPVYLGENENVKIFYSFKFIFPDRNRIDAFFDKYGSMYEYWLHEMGKALKLTLYK